MSVKLLGLCFAAATTLLKVFGIINRQLRQALAIELDIGGL